jgi:hypothetical protein
VNHEWTPMVTNGSKSSVMRSVAGANEACERDRHSVFHGGVAAWRYGDAAREEGGEVVDEVFVALQGVEHARQGSGRAFYFLALMGRTRVELTRPRRETTGDGRDGHTIRNRHSEPCTMKTASRRKPTCRRTRNERSLRWRIERCPWIGRRIAVKIPDHVVAPPPIATHGSAELRMLKPHPGLCIVHQPV